MRTTLPAVLRNGWNLIRKSVGGFLGVFGFLLSMIIVPIYLYYFLIESRNISESWGDYIPLRASAFKDEVVSVLAEINGYLIAFFRGQLLVSLLNGTATGIGLVAVGLDFGLLIGLLLCLLGLIPYLGIILCWIPAVIIAIVQGGAGTWVPSQPWWLFPVIVTGIFAIVQQIDGLFITPKVVGESVGLHPMTVIVSVFVWSLLMGGLLGAILAVPMTATVKVLLKRYVWQRRFMAEPRVVPNERRDCRLDWPFCARSPQRKMTQKNPRTIVSNTTFRDSLIAGICAVLILGFIIYGIATMASKPVGNRLTGTITERRFTPAPEQQIEFGKKGIQAREIEGEHIFVVRVEPEKRTTKCRWTRSFTKAKRSATRSPSSVRAQSRSKPPL
jgi:hypothetical protein